MPIFNMENKFSELTIKTPPTSPCIKSIIYFYDNYLSVKRSSGDQIKNVQSRWLTFSHRTNLANGIRSSIDFNNPISLVSGITSSDDAARLLLNIYTFVIDLYGEFTEGVFKDTGSNNWLNMNANNFDFICNFKTVFEEVFYFCDDLSVEFKSTVDFTSFINNYFSISSANANKRIHYIFNSAPTGAINIFHRTTNLLGNEHYEHLDLKYKSRVINISQFNKRLIDCSSNLDPSNCTPSKDQIDHIIKYIISSHIINKFESIIGDLILEDTRKLTDAIQLPFADKLSNYLKSAHIYATGGGSGTSDICNNNDILFLDYQYQYNYTDSITNTRVETTATTFKELMKESNINFCKLELPPSSGDGRPGDHSFTTKRKIKQRTKTNSLSLFHFNEQGDKNDYIRIEKNNKKTDFSFKHNDLKYSSGSLNELNIYSGANKGTFYNIPKNAEIIINNGNSSDEISTIVIEHSIPYIPPPTKIQLPNDLTIFIDHLFNDNEFVISQTKYDDEDFLQDNCIEDLLILINNSNSYQLNISLTGNGIGEINNNGILIKDSDQRDNSTPNSLNNLNQKKRYSELSVQTKTDNNILFIDIIGNGYVSPLRCTWKDYFKDFDLLNNDTKYIKLKNTLKLGTQQSMLDKQTINGHTGYIFNQPLSIFRAIGIYEAFIQRLENYNPIDASLNITLSSLIIDLRSKLSNYNIIIPRRSTLLEKGTITYQQYEELKIPPTY